MPRLLVLMAVLLVTLHGSVQAVVVIGPGGEPLPAVRLAGQSVSVAIEDRSAETTVRQTWRNSTGRDLEAEFLVPLPADATLAEFRMTANGETLEAVALEAGEARRVYESIVRRLRDPALLEYLDARTIRARVYPVPANGDLELVYLYRQPVPSQGSYRAYEFQPPGHSGSVAGITSTIKGTIRLDARIGPVLSPTHDIEVERGEKGREAAFTAAVADAAAPFLLLFVPAEEGPAVHLAAHRHPGAERGHFLLTLTPPALDEDVEALPKDVIFVIDTSGSMSDPGKLDKAASAFRQCLSALNPEDRFGLVGFASTVEVYRNDLTPADNEGIRGAGAWLERRRARGGTAIAAALSAAAELAKDASGDRPVSILFLTDGLPTIGLTDRVQILPIVEDSPARVFPLGFGSDVNTALLDDIARVTGGFATYISPELDLELVIAGLFESLSTPVMTAIELEIAGVETEERFPVRLPDLYAGRDTLVTGVYTESGVAQIRVRGHRGGKKIELQAEAELPAETGDATLPVRALWAQRKVAFLLEEIRRNGETEELTEEVRLLGLEFGIITPYTSFLAAPDEEDTIAFGDARMPGVAITDRVGGLREHDGRVRGMIARRRNEAMAQPEAATATTGALANYAAQSINAMKADAVARRQTTFGRSKFAVDGTMNVAVRQGREFRQAGPSAPWVEQNAVATRPEPDFTVRYLSPAYFQLLEEWPGQRGALLLGERVVLQVGRNAVAIDPDAGIAEELPEALRNSS